MAKKIIVLEKQAKSQFRIAFWLDVPAARQQFFVTPDKTSAYRDATQEEIDALKLGQIYEHLELVESRGQNQTQLRATLEEMHANIQAELNARDTWQRYGSFWDGSVWTNAGVP